MVNEDRRLSSQLDELRAERARLQAELEREVARGIGVQGGVEDAADDEIDSRVLATFIQLRRMAVHMRQVAEASLEKAFEDLRRADDVIASLRAQLQAAETQLQEQALELEVVRRKESEEDAFRETHPWLAALVERHKRPSGAWPQNLRQGYAMMSFLGQHKYDLVRQFIGGPALRDVRRWKLTHLAAPKSADGGLDGSPTACVRYGSSWGEL
jgi:acetylornithine deacetylase/succinyl-diaminopimelate desuccinylase-like protein